MPAVSTIASSARRPRALATLGRLVPPAAAALAGAGPIVLLGFSQGGYPVHVVAGYGVALWWLLLVGILTRAIPRPDPSGLGWLALAAITLLAVWGSLSLTWSADPERGLTEVARAVVGGGSLLLGMSAVRSGHGRALASGVLGGLTIIVGAAVLSRLIPTLAPGATAEAAEFLPSTRTRLAWPLNYWNTIAVAAAMAIPLGLTLATRSRNPWLSGLAVAPTPFLALGLAFTLSRGGILALGVGVIAAVMMTAPRPVLLRTMVTPTIASAIVLVFALGDRALVDVVGGAAQSDAGGRVIVVAALTIIGAFLVQAGLASADAAHWTPRIRRSSRRTFAVTAGVVVAALALGALAGGAPDRVGDAWDRFRAPLVVSGTNNINTPDRLGSISSNGRYAMWSAATDAFVAHPVKGLGLGAWESWWNPRRADTGFVRNAHSQFFEQLAETGLIGVLAFVALLTAPIAAAIGAAVRRRPQLPDAVIVGPPFAAFALGLAVDWHWQITALAVAGLTLAAVALSHGDGRNDSGPAAPPRRSALQAVALGLVAIGSIAVLAVALVAPQSVQESRDAVADGDFAAAARAADDGAAAAAFAASPLLQRALVAEQAGDLAAAADAAAEATRRTPADWRPWFVLARVATGQGDHARAVQAFREARHLNPRSPLLR